nr:PCRF domain-containing protein [Mycoplasmopsis bovis]
MYKSLSEIKQSYLELLKKVDDPAVINNIKEYSAINKEIAKIREISEKFITYENLLKDVEQAKLMLESKSDEEVEFAKMIIDENSLKLEELEEKLKILILPQDENDDKNIIVEIRGALLVEMRLIYLLAILFRMYNKFADELGFRLKILSTNSANAGGFSQIVFSIKGEKAYSKFKFESGVHRVQRVPVTESQGRIHTSTTTVTVMPEIDDTVDIEIKPSDLKIDVFRSKWSRGTIS